MRTVFDEMLGKDQTDSMLIWDENSGDEDGTDSSDEEDEVRGTSINQDLLLSFDSVTILDDDEKEEESHCDDEVENEVVVKGVRRNAKQN